MSSGGFVIFQKRKGSNKAYIAWFTSPRGVYAFTQKFKNCWTFLEVGCKQLSLCLSGVSWPMSDLLAVGGGTHDMFSGIVRQNYTGAHFHACGWISPQRLFILCFLRSEKFFQIQDDKAISVSAFFWNFFHCNLSNTTKLTSVSYTHLTLPTNREV